MSKETCPEITFRPITPEEVTKARVEQIPSEVIQVFNSLITEKSSYGSANIPQQEIVDQLVEMGLDEAEIYRRGWLNVEDIYREAGWKVEYDKPGYNESYAANFTFRAPR